MREREDARKHAIGRGGGGGGVHRRCTELARAKANCIVTGAATGAPLINARTTAAVVRRAFCQFPSRALSSPSPLPLARQFSRGQNSGQRRRVDWGVYGNEGDRSLALARGPPPVARRGRRAILSGAMISTLSGRVSIFRGEEGRGGIARGLPERCEVYFAALAFN